MYLSYMVSWVHGCMGSWVHGPREIIGSGRSVKGAEAHVTYPTG